MALSITRECMLYEDCVNKGIKIFSYKDMHEVISFDCGVLCSYNYNEKMGEDEKKRKLMTAKYIMEYLYNDCGYVVANDGCSVMYVRGYQYDDTIGKKRNILDLEHSSMIVVALIYHIVNELYYHGDNIVYIAVTRDPGMSFLNWAEKIPLTGHVKLICAIKEDQLTTYNYDVLHIEKEKDIIALTPEREERYYKEYYNNYIALQQTEEPTIISISRTSDGKLELTNNVLHGSFKNRRELLSKLKEEFITDEVDESIILAYNKSYIPERLVYEKEADFYAGFYYKNGVFSRKRQRNAFERFHVLYIEMLAQHGIDYYEMINSDIFDSNGGNDEG